MHQVMSGDANVTWATVTDNQRRDMYTFAASTSLQFSSVHMVLVSNCLGRMHVITRPRSYAADNYGVQAADTKVGGERCCVLP